MIENFIQKGKTSACETPKEEKAHSKYTKYLSQNHFIGINIDFEDLNLDRDEPLTQFVKEWF